MVDEPSQTYPCGASGAPGAPVEDDAPDSSGVSRRARRGLFRRQLWGVWLVVGLMIVVAGFRVWGSGQRHPIDFRTAGDAVTYKVNINKATWQDLTVLRGVGEKRAQSIVEWRQEHGPFESVEDLKKIKGVGDSLIEGIRNDIEF